MGAFVALAGSLGFTGRAKSVAGFILALIAIAVVAALCWWMASRYLSGRDDRVIGADRDKSNVEVLGKTVKADRIAGAAKDERDAEVAATAAEQRRKADEARRKNASALDAVARGLRADAPH